MVKYVAIDTDDMVNYIHSIVEAQGLEVSEDLILAVLDAETDYMINYAMDEEES